MKKINVEFKGSACFPNATHPREFLRRRLDIFGWEYNADAGGLKVCIM
jgi:hypothetical protein